MKSFDEKFYICQTCHKHFCKNKIQYQALCSKMPLDPITDELKHFKKLEKVLISTRILFKKMTLAHRKGDFLKTK